MVIFHCYVSSPEGMWIKKNVILLDLKTQPFPHSAVQQGSRPVLSLADLGLYEGGRPWCCGITNHKSQIGDGLSLAHMSHIAFATLFVHDFSWFLFMISVFHQVLFRATLLGPARSTGQILSKLTGQQRDGTPNHQRKLMWISYIKWHKTHLKVNIHMSTLFCTSQMGCFIY